MVTINFELDPEYINCFLDLDPKVIINAIVALKKTKITPGKTLLFLDEIQDCPNAIVALRYFHEKMPELHIVSAGSLLEFTLREENFSMPVGRVESIYLKPMSFDEFLVAYGYTDLIENLHNLKIGDTLNSAIEHKAQKLLHEYFITGGMPNVVRQYIANQDLHEVKILQASILDTYRRDFGKYAKGARVNYLRRLFERAPGIVAEQFKYSHVDPHMQSRDLKPALADLVDAGIINQVFSTSASGIPLNSMMNDKKFKLIFLDVGLVKFTNNLDADILLNSDLMLINRGSLAEQFVGQELITLPPNYYPKELYYWEREKPGSTAEVDYIINVGEQIIPVEVKAGKTGSLRSLQEFLNEKNQPYGIRISMKSLSFKGRVLSIPLYMISQLDRIIKSL
jgi:predicted AAA+ superfamily ATPase